MSNRRDESLRENSNDEIRMPKNDEIPMTNDETNALRTEHDDRLIALPPFRHSNFVIRILQQGSCL
jgi:hypothetical protein